MRISTGVLTPVWHGAGLGHFFRYKALVVFQKVVNPEIKFTDLVVPKVRESALRKKHLTRLISFVDTGKDPTSSFFFVPPGTNIL